MEDYNHPEFVKPSFSVFNPAETISFFESLGITPKVEDLGKTFPLSEQASSMVDVLKYELDSLKVKVICDAYVQTLVKKNHKFNIYLSDGTLFEGDRVLICTGGLAMPKTGSDGSGYALALSLGHHLTKVFPALVKLTLDSPYLKHLDGVKIPGKVELLHDSLPLQAEYGDILFTKYGISGPTILQLSRLANELLDKNQNVSVRVHLVNTISKKEVFERFELAMNKPVDFSLVGLINKRIISAILKEAGITKQNVLVSELTKEEIRKLIDLLFAWDFRVTGSKGYDDAQITAGGIDVSEIHPDTLESLLVKGLYFAGEIVDIDGRCGGYNLQWAWSSAYVAGKSATQGSQDD